MLITLSPVRGPVPLVLSRRGDILTVNGEVLDLSPLPEGAELPREAIACPFLAGPVTRSGGVLHLTLVLPHGAAAPEETRFPAPLTVTGDGPVTLPPYDAPLPDEVMP